MRNFHSTLAAAGVILGMGSSVLTYAQAQSRHVMPSVRDQLDEMAGFESLRQIVDRGNRLPELYRSSQLHNQRQIRFLQTAPAEFFAVALPVDVSARAKSLHEQNDRQDASSERPRDKQELLKNVAPDQIERQPHRGRNEMLERLLTAAQEHAGQQDDRDRNVEWLKQRREVLGQQLRATDDADQIRALKDQLRRLETAMKRLAHDKHHDGHDGRDEHDEHDRHDDAGSERGGRNADGELYRKLEQLEEKQRGVQHKLRNSDNDQEREELTDLVQKLSRWQEEIEHELNDRNRDHSDRDDHRRHREEVDRQHDEHEQRIRALHEAAERLAHGGLPDMAHELHRQAEHLEREIHRQRNGGRREEEVLHELMENVHKLQHDVRELHEKIDVMMEFIEEVRDSDDDG